MDYLDSKNYSGVHAAHPDITNRLKACAGRIISQALIIENVPQSAREIMANHVIHQFVRAAFRDVVVDCLATYFTDLEERRKEVLDDLVSRTKSEEGMRLRLLHSAMERTHYGVKYRDVLNNLDSHITPQIYAGFVAVVRQEYARQ